MSNIHQEAEFRYFHTITDEGAVLKQRKEAERKEATTTGTTESLAVDEVLLLKPMEGHELRTEQRKEEELQLLMDYIEQGQVPEYESDRKRIMSKALLFKMNNDGVLIRCERVRKN